MKENKLLISGHPAISAIYYALLQCGYDFYPIERDPAVINELERFLLPDSGEFFFFMQVRQNTCQAYPYWPRAAMLETAVFYMDLPGARFADWDGYKHHILSAKNIANGERNEIFWNWVAAFPAALEHVMQSDGFHRYQDWVCTWIAQQNQAHQYDLRRIEALLALCRERFGSPVHSVQIVLDPIKCVYASDYHIRDGDFLFCLGELRADSVLHEFLHHSVHPVVEARKAEILSRDLTGLSLDDSYYLDGSGVGKLNAFEESVVRRLTGRILRDDPPRDLDRFLDCEIANLKP